MSLINSLDDTRRRGDTLPFLLFSSSFFFFFFFFSFFSFFFLLFYFFTFFLLFYLLFPPTPSLPPSVVRTHAHMGAGHVLNRTLLSHVPGCAAAYVHDAFSAWSGRLLVPHMSVFVSVMFPLHLRVVVAWCTP